MRCRMKNLLALNGAFQVRKIHLLINMGSDSDADEGRMDDPECGPEGQLLPFCHNESFGM